MQARVDNQLEHLEMDRASVLTWAFIGFYSRTAYPVRSLCSPVSEDFLVVIVSNDHLNSVAKQRGLMSVIYTLYYV